MAVCTSVRRDETAAIERNMQGCVLAVQRPGHTFTMNEVMIAKRRATATDIPSSGSASH